MTAPLPKRTIYRLLGWTTHSKRSRYGHYFVAGKCVDCGKVLKEKLICLK